MVQLFNAEADWTSFAGIGRHFIEVSGSNPTHGRQLHFCRGHALRVYSANSIKLAPVFVDQVLHIELGFKIRVYVIR